MTGETLESAVGGDYKGNFINGFEGRCDIPDGRVANCCNWIVGGVIYLASACIVMYILADQFQGSRSSAPESPLEIASSK